MNEHWLKTWPELFESTIQGIKGFEYRLNDRGFKPGDSLMLREFDPEPETYTGRTARVQVLRLYEKIPGLPDGFCIMEIQLRETWMLNQAWESPKCAIPMEHSCDLWSNQF